MLLVTSALIIVLTFLKGGSCKSYDFATRQMGTKNKSYYRNWYQHWKEEEQEKLEQSMNEVRAYQYNIETNQYKANHDLSRQYAGYSQSQHRKSQSPYSAHRRQSQMTDINLSGQNQFADVLRGLLVGLPLVVVLLAMLYAGGIIPQDTVNRLLGIDTTSPVTEYIDQYDELMGLHNNINKSLSEHISANNITSTYIQELQTEQQNIRTQTQALLSNNDEIFSEMGRLLNLKLASLDQLITQITTSESVTDEVTSSYNQFVSDQNEVGNQIVLALTSILDDNNIQYTKQVNGAIQIK